MGFFGPKTQQNPRCAVALKEATDFLFRLQRVEKELKALHKAADSALAGCKDTLNAPLPHIYEEMATACGGAVKSLESIGGPGFSPEQMLRYTVELNQAMQSQVLGPLQLWATNYKEAVERQKRVEKLWAEVDSRRIKVKGLQEGVDKLRTKAQGDSKAAAKLEEATKTMQHKESKLTNTTAQYERDEAEQYEKLCVLIKDAVFLRAYIKTALAQVAAALAGASDSMITFLPDDQGPQPVVAPPPPQQVPAAPPTQLMQQMSMAQHPHQQLPPGMAHQATTAHSATMPVARHSSQEQAALQGPGAAAAYGRSFGRSSTMSQG